MEKDFRLNIVTLGKTGVGKSSLLNYLFGTKFETGTGRPVTPADLIETDADINGHAVRVYDSWGIEADKLTEWNSLLKNKAFEHGAAKNPEEWFHAVVYCINAGGSRIEDCDAIIISNFVNQGYKVTVAITKAELIDEEDEKELKKAIFDSIGKEKINVVSVCCVNKKNRLGESKPFGRDELIDSILSSWVETVKNRISTATIERLCGHLDTFKSELNDLVDNYDISGRREGNDELAKLLETKIQAKMQELRTETVNDEAKDLLKRCYDIGYNLQSSFGEISLSEIHTPFMKFDTENNKNIGWWYAGYALTLGIMPLINSVGSTFKNNQRERIKDVIEDAIAKGKKGLKEELLPKLQTEIEKLLEAKKN